TSLLYDLNSTICCPLKLDQNYTMVRCRVAAWFTRTILADSPFVDYGFLRITRDLFRIPGVVEMDQGQLLSVKLLKSSPYAEDLLACLQRFWE
ncbi:MAG: hypothetical protein JXM69_15985, partial [Anaerolineae bacterium]|nr:hypothetical protein [Anaerolineae bacterium]